MNGTTTRHLRNEADKLVKSLSIHRNTAKAARLIPRATRRLARRELAVLRLKYPTCRVVVPA